MRRFNPWGVLFGLLAFAFLLFHRTWLSGCDDCYMGIEQDPRFFIWSLAWIPHAIGEGMNPLYSDYIGYPTGANLMYVTSIPLPSLVFSPITEIFGSFASYRILITLAPPLSGTVAFLAFRRFVSNDVAALTGALIYGFSPYAIAQSLGHPNLALAWFPPFILVMLDEVVFKQTRSPRALGIVLGAGCVAQLLTGAEMLVTTSLMAGLALVIIMIMNRGAVKERGAFVWKVILVAALTFLVLGAGPLANAALVSPRVSGPYHEFGIYVNDLLNFVVPTETLAIAPDFLTDITERFTGNIHEWNAYLGLPLLALIVFVAFRYRGVPLVRAASIFLAIVAMLSLGPSLHVAGTDTNFPLPWAVIQKIPVLWSILPARLMLFGYLAVGLLVASFVHVVLRDGSPRLAFAPIAVALIPLIPTFDFPVTRTTIPEFFSESVHQEIPEGSVALVTPITQNSIGVTHWQVQADFRYRMADVGWSSSQLRTTLGEIERTGEVPSLDEGLKRNLMNDLADRDVSYVIVGPGPQSDAISSFIAGLLQEMPNEVEGVRLWEIGSG